MADPEGPNEDHHKPANGLFAESGHDDVGFIGSAGRGRRIPVRGDCLWTREKGNAGFAVKVQIAEHGAL